HTGFPGLRPLPSGTTTAPPLSQRAGSGFVRLKCGSTSPQSVRLVCRRLFRTIDDENIDWASPGLQFEPELFVQGGEDRRAAYVGRWIRDGRRIRVSRSQHSRREIEINVEPTGEPSLIVHDTTYIRKLCQHPR